MAATALLGCRFAVGLLFMLAAIGKARSAANFIATLRALGVPGGLTAATAAAIVAAEGFVGTAFLLSALVRVATLVCLGLLTLFAAVSVVAIKSARSIPCGCFGGPTDILGPLTLARSITLAVPAIVFGSSESLAQTHDPELLVLGLITAAGGLLIARWIFAASQIRSLVASRKALERDVPRTTRPFAPVASESP